MPAKYPFKLPHFSTHYQGVIVTENLDGELIHFFSKAFQSFDSASEKLTRTYVDLENTLACILESMAAGVVVIGLQGHITLFNQAAEKLMGIKAENVIGLPYNDIFGDRPFLMKTLETGEAHISHEAFIQRRSVTLPLPVEISTSPIVNANGETIGALELIRDISERKQLEEQLTRSKALAELGKMAAEIAHDLRNPLGAIRLYVGMLQQELNGDLKQLADSVARGINTLESITYNLLSLARPIKPNFQFIDLVSLIDDVLTFTIYAMEEKNIKLVQDYERDGTLICYGDFEQLKQTALNLILNAIQAMPHGGELRITGRIVEDKDLILLSIEDSGVGIPVDIQEKIFTPFFTTKSSGTGLGLHTVDRIIQAHYGRVRVKSTEGIGTQFFIELPRDARQKQVPIFSVNDLVSLNETHVSIQFTQS